MNLMELIGRLGIGAYQDGSSASPGHLYQPIGDFVVNLPDVPIHKSEAVRDDYHAVVQDYGSWRDKGVLEIGSANGYYGLGLQQEGVAKFSGVERDPAARSLCIALGLDVVSDIAEVTRAQVFDVGLCLNVHMWFHKQGNDAPLMMLLSNLCQTVYFQTAGKNSAGRYKVEALDTQQDESDYLSQWFDHVRLVRETPLHGGVRRLFRCA